MAFQSGAVEADLKVEKSFAWNNESKKKKIF